MVRFKICAMFSSIYHYHIIKDHAVLSFLAKNITLKPASNFLHNSLAVLVRHSQAQKCLQSDPLTSFYGILKISYLIEFFY